MSKLQTILLAVLLGAAAGLLYKFVPALNTLAATFALAASGLVGWVFQHPADKTQPTDDPRSTQAGHGTPATFMLVAFVGVAMFFGVALTSGCKQVKPDQFFEAVVDCAKINPESSAASSAVLTCLTAAISGNPSACLTGLVTEAHWTVDEVACIVADIAQRENKKVQLDGDPKAAHVRGVAVDWLVRERIAIRNTYAGAQ